MGRNMEKCIFISPGDTILGRELTDRADKNGNQVISAVTEDLDLPEDKQDQSPLYCRWNRRSLLSARNAVLAGLNAFETIDTAIIIHETVQDENPIHELAPVIIEQSVDVLMKSHFFMLREILSVFVRRGGGTLALVHYSPGEYTQLPLCAASSSAFRSAADSLCTLYQNENIRINSFDCSKEKPEGFANYIFQTLTGKAAGSHGKWYHFGTAGRNFGRR
ncbi:MAG: hypothetical protein HN368_17270 [Spirochaetales bacterium]|jgi:NAD(P)-dependent dehydrogenase (short-subunit alcohol dehydrogenase family)|nr:hypothetical protein [Spirochaetales bacterium]